MFDSGKKGEIAPEARHEEFVTVRNDLGGETVLTVPFVEKKEGELFGGKIRASGDEVIFRV